MRLLPVGADHVSGRLAREKAKSERRGHRRRDERKHLPLRHVSENSQGHPSSGFARSYGEVNPFLLRSLSSARQTVRSVMLHSAMLDRRDFLKSGAAAGVGLLIGFHLDARETSNRAEEQEKKPANPFDAWVRITPDNRVTLILAEELCVDWKQVKVQQAPTNPQVYDHGTGGSGSVAGSWLPLRRAGAAAREMLVTAAATRWSVNRDTCVAKDGGVLHGARKNFLTYGELAGDAAKLPLPDLKTVPLKNSGEFTIVGRDIPRIDAKEKATGTAKFGIDARVPGMLYAVVARCPAFGGKVKSFDATEAKGVAGVRDVLAIDAVAKGAFTSGGVVVLADNSWAAMEGRRALKIVWDEGP